MKTYFIKTYGCQMNVADSAKLASVLESFGYQIISSSEGEGLPAGRQALSLSIRLRSSKL